MTKLASEFSAAVDMAQSVGLAKTFVRVRNYAGARINESHRKRRFKKLGLSGRIERSVLGNTMTLDTEKGGLDRDILLDGIREPMATGHILSILNKDDIVLEVGANIGYYALLEAKIVNKVYAVEPHPDNFERLKANVAQNAHDNVQVFQGAFGEVNGKIPLYTSELSNWHSCHTAPDSNQTFIEVDCFTVDTFASTHEMPTFVKMDVEGFELQVLRGAKNTLKNIRHLFIELHGTMLSRDEINEVLDLIAGSGLKPSLIVQYDRPGMARLYEMDQLDMIRKGDRGVFELFFCRDQA